MNRKSVVITVAIASMLFLLGGCGMSGQSNSEERQQVEGLKELGQIQVISREEGSGTRSTFAQMADFMADTENGQTDLTTQDAVIANDAEEVIRNVESNPSAIGYVSEAALTGNEKVKSLNIEGRSPEEIEKYSLSRNFYLAYSGKLNDLEQDFLTYIHGAGQEIVGENYVQVAKSSSFLSNQAGGEITIEGSTSVAPLMEKLAEAYEKINANARIIVEENNPLSDITLEELKSIYTGETKNWDDLNQ